MALTEAAHDLIGAHFAAADMRSKIALDATCGNGHDSLFLAKLGFSHIYLMDVQKIAVEKSADTLRSTAYKTFSVIRGHHKDIKRLIDINFDCVMFNLGYLPSGDKSLTTTTISTQIASQYCLERLSSAGIMTIMCYPGHAEGERELRAIESWRTQLDNDVTSHRLECATRTTVSPVLFSFIKK